MASVNEVILIGRLGKDPEALEMKNGKVFCKLRLATSKKLGEEEVTQWHNVTVFSENDARFAIEYMRSGALVYLKGELEYSSYEKEGMTIYRTDIIVGRWGSTLQLLSDGKPRGEGQSQVTRKKYSDSKPASKREYTDEQRAADRAEFDDDIPF